VAPNILLVEDDRRLAEMVSEYLGEAGFSVSVAGDGRTGLARLAAEPCDALVLDLMLPDMDGLEVCRQLRAFSAPRWRPSGRRCRPPTRAGSAGDGCGRGARRRG
jgi:DNA-binding response OmpR family regulator